MCNIYVQYIYIYNCIHTFPSRVAAAMIFKIVKSLHSKHHWSGSARHICDEETVLRPGFACSFVPQLNATCTTTNLRDCETKKSKEWILIKNTHGHGVLFLHIPPDYYTPFQQGGIQGGIPLIEHGLFHVATDSSSTYSGKIAA